MPCNLAYFLLEGYVFILWLVSFRNVAENQLGCCRGGKYYALSWVTTFVCIFILTVNSFLRSEHLHFYIRLCKLLLSKRFLCFKHTFTSLYHRTYKDTESYANAVYLLRIILLNISFEWKEKCIMCMHTYTHTATTHTPVTLLICKVHTNAS